MIPRVFITTCKPYYWALRPFMYLFAQYWSTKQSVVIAGYESLPFDLPSTWEFHSISPKTYPKKQWLKGILEFLTSVPDNFFTWMLEDYWLVRPVDHPGIRTLADYMDINRDVIRIDLTADRYYAGKVDRPHLLGEDGNKEICYGHYDLIPSNVNSYHLSTQAGIWNKNHLVALMKKCIEIHGDMSPWEFELNGTTVLREKFPELKVYGTRQFPVRYTIGLKLSESDKVNTVGIPKQHLESMKEMGYFDKKS